jgi:hypothetical protein
MSLRISRSFTAFKFDIDKLKDKEFHQQFGILLAAKLKSNAQPQIKDSEIEVC